MPAPVHHLPTSTARRASREQVVMSDGVGVAVSQPTRTTVLVRMCGEIDYSTVERCTRTLHRSVRAVADETRHRGRPTDGTVEAGGRVVCDLEGVTFLAAAGLRMLVETADRAAADGVVLAVRVSDGPARRLLRRTGVEEYLDVHDDLASALDPEGHPAVVPPLPRPA